MKFKRFQQDANDLEDIGANEDVEEGVHLSGAPLGCVDHGTMVFLAEDMVQNAMGRGPDSRGMADETEDLLNWHD
ncbi:hypothetical protein Nepgr_031822 [Nepenthes gracilis]|uniref:Uncharacterized protein n=1 Tax=Nepenthes gracilis TaxID=150966 RepID=A0AAD3TIU6_NEPGR|nr:hypothetical protein Nepgr_031822 [Nepenthes gracilis]